MRDNTAKLVMFSVMMILLVGGMAIPLAHHVTDSETTYHNTGEHYRLTAQEGSRTLTLSAVDGGYLLADDEGSALIDGFFLPAPNGKGIAPAIGIGLYESYNNGGVLVSQSGRVPTLSQTMDSFRTMALANNTDNAHSVFQPWNWFNYTAYKLMATTVMGNTDSQYMFGMGDVDSVATPMTTGLTTSAYTKSQTTADSVCLLLENTWGSAWDSLTDTCVNNRVLLAGNDLGGHSNNTSINNVLTTTVQTPATVSRGYILTISMASDTFGAPLTARTNSATDPGTSINDCTWTNSSGAKMVSAGAIWQDSDRAGLYALNTSNATTWASNQSNTRLACYLNDNPLKGNDYGYILSISSAGVVSDVSVKTEDGMVSVMPNGTDINDFWQFDTDTGLGPFNCYYVAMNLYDGDNFDDTAQPRLSKEKGDVAYILDPYSLTSTLQGYTFNPMLYNVMMIVPTLYWYSDGNGQVYMGSTPDMFEGITMQAYGHTFTKRDDTGNIGFHSVKEFAYGDGLILRISDTGALEILTPDSDVSAGTITTADSIVLSIENGILTVDGTEYGELWAYRDDAGDFVSEVSGYVLSDSVVIAGGYGPFQTESEVDVVAGYTGRGTVGEATEVAIVYPVSSLTPVPDSTQADIQYEVKGELYRLDSVGFSTTWSDDSQSQVRYANLIVPEYVSYSNSLSDKEYVNVTITVAPIFVFIALIYVVYMYLSKRNDYLY